MSGSRMYPKWENWAWVGIGHLCLGPIWIVYGLNRHGLEVVTYVLVPYGLCMG